MSLFTNQDLKGEDNINFQFIFCLSQKWDHGDDAARTRRESEYLVVQDGKKKQKKTEKLCFVSALTPVSPNRRLTKSTHKLLAGCQNSHLNLDVDGTKARPVTLLEKFKQTKRPAFFFFF